MPHSLPRVTMDVPALLQCAAVEGQRTIRVQYPES